jgi:hypothetical protein
MDSGFFRILIAVHVKGKHVISNKIKPNQQMNTKKISYRRLPNLLVMLPFIATLFFAVNPAHAGIFHRAAAYSKLQLTGFEGYYQFDKDKNRYLQIMV